MKSSLLQKVFSVEKRFSTSNAINRNGEFSGQRKGDGDQTIADCDNETVSGYKGEDYRGCQQRTRYGYVCQNWMSQSPHRHHMVPDGDHGDKGLGDHNFCRNPDTNITSSDTIWCYTTAEWPVSQECDPKTGHEWETKYPGKTCHASSRITHRTSSECFNDLVCSAASCRDDCDKQPYCRYFYLEHVGDEYTCDTFHSCRYLEDADAGGTIWGWATNEINRVPTCGGNANSAPCMFPFVYKGNQYNHCINEGYGSLWCLTEQIETPFARWGECNCSESNPI